MPDLLLDPGIRDWVLLPLVGITVAVTLFRNYLMQLLQKQKQVEGITFAQQNRIQRSARLRRNGGYINSARYESRKTQFVAAFSKKAYAVAQNPMAMMDTMFSRMPFMVSNMLMMVWVSYSFSGFVLVKLPFSLTDRFKSMTQRGIELLSLDPSYVSSLSWYILVMSGVGGIISLFTTVEDPMMAEAQMMQAQMGMMTGGAPGQWNPAKAYEQEKGALETSAHKSRLEEAENWLLGNK